ncbi:MAG: hypothetical protein JWL70_353, partial [Acidimicrobiia bacterium]|nr:hypothetical protein [Acidimicrobiia bacterium]
EASFDLQIVAIGCSMSSLPTDSAEMAGPAS